MEIANLSSSIAGMTLSVKRIAYLSSAISNFLDI
ncbi:hypothetical protein PM3016_3619 [Paenibacillus mucilaginosus 3016]|uniref:Uncharacterized protein n=1 Tax=Paenibacillus mucilaginosus 3016 TaxID=1116391 RepID=H6NNR4_9BACL|nr:hypothetical protein PM3016_3619 [Paenibacillus mucilaginosus 3016]